MAKSFPARPWLYNPRPNPPYGRILGASSDSRPIPRGDTAGPLGYCDLGTSDRVQTSSRTQHQTVAWNGDDLKFWNWGTIKNKPPTGLELKADPKVKDCLLACLAFSYKDNGEVQGEQGGWIYGSPYSPGEYHFEISKERFKNAINLELPLDLSHKRLWVVGTFHTHPRRDELARYPSSPGDPGIGKGKEADTEVQKRFGVPGLIINYLQEIHPFGPTSRNRGWDGGYGFPGPLIPWL